MKKLLNILTVLGFIIGSTLTGAIIVNASICPVIQGCTGVNTLNGILIGSGTTPVTTTALPSDATKYLDGTGNFSTPAGSGGTVTSVSGTANRITSTGGTIPVLDISGSYVGQSSITTLGTVSTGIWQGNPVGTLYGGTGGTTPSISLFNNITGYTASGATGTTSTNLVFSTSPTLITPILGTPQSVTLTNATGLPISSGVSGLGTGVATFLATPSSANLLSALTTSTGTGNAVFATNPVFTTPNIGSATASGLTLSGITGSTQCLHVNTSGVVSGTGSDCGSGGGGSGTVTTVSVVTNQGVSGSVANPTMTPAITLTLGALTGVTSYNGLVVTPNTGVITTGTWNGTAIANANLANSTISGVSLGGTLGALTATNGTLTFSGSYTGASAQTVGINLANANTWTAGQTISTAPLTISGNQSQSAWTTNGTQLSIAAASLTDTTSSGTVAAMGVDAFGIPTLLASSATTYTIGATVYIAGAPVSSTNVTNSNPMALYVAAGRAVFNGGLSTSSAFASSNFTGIAGNGIQASSNTAALLFGGASGVQMRALFNGNNSTTLSTGTSYSNVIVGSAPVTTFSSGTHSLLANMVVNPLGTVTSGGAAVTNTATLYVNGAGSGGTTNYSLWDVGQSRFDLGSDATGDTFYRASTGVFTRLPIGATGTHLVVSGGIPSWTAQTGVSNYTHTIFQPTTGQTISLVNNQYNIINPAGALLALTVNLPSSPANNDVVYIKFTQTISTVTYANGTVVDGITAPTAGGLTILTYDSGTSSWY